MLGEIHGTNITACFSTGGTRSWLIIIGGVRGPLKQLSGRHINYV